MFLMKSLADTAVERKYKLSSVERREAVKIKEQGAIVLESWKILN